MSLIVSFQVPPVRVALVPAGLAGACPAKWMQTLTDVESDKTF